MRHPRIPTIDHPPGCAGRDASDVPVFDRARRPTIDELMQFEDGQLDEDEQRDLLTRLRDTGMLYQLQGFYGRAARRMGVI